MIKCKLNKYKSCFLIGVLLLCILGYIHLLTIYEKEILFIIMILILCYSLIFVIINISKYEIIVTNEYLVRIIAIPHPFVITVKKKKFLLNELVSVIKLKNLKLPIHSFSFFFQNGIVSLGSSLDKFNEILIFIYNNTDQKFYSKKAIDYIKCIK